MGKINELGGFWVLEDEFLNFKEEIKVVVMVFFLKMYI